MLQTCMAQTQVLANAEPHLRSFDHNDRKMASATFHISVNSIVQ